MGKRGMDVKAAIGNAFGAEAGSSDVPLTREMKRTCCTRSALAENSGNSLGLEAACNTLSSHLAVSSRKY